MQVYGCLYEKGMRESNQDSIALQKILTKKGEVILAALCDGMGGMEEGETASGYVAEKVSCWFYEELPMLLEKHTGRKIIKRSLCRKLFHLHVDLKEYGKKKNIITGTTVSILLIIGNRYMICHLGDSVVYLLNKRLRRMTNIHGNAASQIHRCIGAGKFYPPDIIYGKVRRHTGFILASDGFDHMLEPSEIYCSLKDRFIKNGDWVEKRLRELARKAVQRGETDNISVIYLGQNKNKNSVWQE